MARSAFARVLMGVTVLVASAAPVSAGSSNTTAQVLIVIPERPDLAEAEARAEGRAFSAPAPVRPAPVIVPPMPRALQRLTTLERSAGRPQVLHTQIEPL